MSVRKQQHQIDTRPINTIMNIKSNDDLRSYLEDRPELNLSLMKEANGSTLLHFAAFKNELPKLKFYILHFQAFARQNLKHSKNDPSFENQLKAWINVPNKEGTTAVHFAGLHGNIQMIVFLQRYGANMQVVTNENEDLLFMAVDNNHLKTVVYLLEHRNGKIPFNPNHQNHVGDTPLHKAASAGFLPIVSYFLSFPPADLDPNSHNNEGNTALMLAVRGGHKEIVKRMLLKGVNRHLTNLQEQRAIDIARSLGNDGLVRILNDQFTNWEKLKIICNIKLIYDVEKPTLAYSITFLLFFHILFLPPHLLAQVTLFDSPYYFYGAAGAYYLLIIVLFALLTKKHPKKIPKDLIEVQLPLCAECREQLRSNELHCFICGVCVWRYDHHCPWINNCVSALNIGKFTLFLLLLIIATAQVFFISLSLKIRVFTQITHTSLLPIQQDILDILILVNLFVSSFSLVIMVLLCSLLIDQLKNVFSNSTSYERAKNVQKQSLLSANEHSLAEEDVEQEQGQKSNCISNCCAILSEKYRIN